jgi:hypothetical protein
MSKLTVPATVKKDPTSQDLINAGNSDFNLYIKILTLTVNTTALGQKMYKITIKILHRKIRY